MKQGRQKTITQWEKYGLAIASVTLMMAVKFTLYSLDHKIPPFSLLLTAVAMSAWYGGIGAGLLATILAAMLSWLLYFPFHEAFAWMSLEDWYSVIGFVIEGSLLSMALGIVKSANEQRDASESRYRALFEQTPDGVVVLDDSGFIVEVNGGFPTLLDMPRESLLGRSFISLLPISDKAKVESLWQHLAKVGHLRAEFPLRHFDGHNVELEWLLSSHFVPGQHLLVARDIAARRRLEQAMLRSEAKYRALHDSNMVPIAFWHIDGRITEANDAFLSLMGVTRDTLDKKELYLDKMIAPECLGQCLPAFLEQLRQSRQVTPSEYNYLRSDGKTIPILIGGSLLPGFDDRGVAFALDLSERKASEQAIRRSNERFRFAQRSSGAGAWDWDAMKNIGHWSEEFHNLVGISQPNTVASYESWIACIHPEDRQRVAQEMKQATNQQKPYISIEYRVLHPTRGCRWIEDMGQAEYDQDGRTLRMAGLAIDVTEKRQAQIAQKNLAAIVASSDDAIISATPDGIITSWNQSAERMFGYTSNDVIGKPITQLIATHEHALLDDMLATVASGGRVQHFQSIYFRRDGTAVDVSLSLSPIKDDAGNVIGISKIARDITQQMAAEMALRESEGRFLFLADSSPVMIWMRSVDQESGKHQTYANKAWREFAGITPDQSIEGQWLASIHPEDKDYYIRTCRDAFNKCAAFTVQFRSRRHDGQYRWLVKNGVPRHASHGDLVGYIGSCMDITENKIAEENVCRSEERLRLALEAGQCGIWDWDITQDVIMRSERINQMYGFPSQETPSGYEGLMEMVHPDDRDQVRAEIARALRDGTTFRLEYRTNQAITRWVATNGRIVHDGQGRAVRMLGATLDITERKRIEEEIHHSSQIKQKLLDVAAAMSRSMNLIDVAKVTLSQGLESVDAWRGSLAIVPLSGGLPQGIRPSLVGSGVMCHETCAACSAMSDTAALAFHESRLLQEPLTEWSARHKASFAMDSDYGIVVHTPLLDEQGTVGVLSLVFLQESSLNTALIEALARQCTQAVRRAQIFDWQREAREAAEAANMAKTAFLANMSHEIRTPLGAVLGYAEILIDPTLSQMERKNCVSIIKRHGRLLTDLIDDVLDISKVEAGKLEIERMDMSLNELLSEVTAALNLKASEKSLTLSVTADRKLPDKISSDPTRLRQILLNVVGNAIKFTEKGSVRVHVSQHPHPIHRKHKLIVFEVSDTGTGISQSAAPILFEPFSQADSSTTRRFGGTGLGLALSRRLARALGGDVVLSHSEVGVGSTFIASIDGGYVATATGHAHVRHTENNPMSQSAQDVRLDGVRILVVEDAPENRLLAQLFLTHAGAEVDLAENGEDGVRRAMGHSFDVVLMDLQMPIMDGYEATRCLRRQGFNKPIIALTAHAMKEERDRCFAAGCTGHLTKPINRHLLLQNIQQVMATQAGRERGMKTSAHGLW